MAWNRQTPITPTSKPVLVIGIPQEERLNAVWSTYMLNPLMNTHLDWCDKIPKLARGFPQNLAREQIAEDALKDPKVTHILWVDSDNCCVVQQDGQWKMFDPNAALKMLYDCNVPIVSGLYRAKQPQGFNNAMWMKPANLPQGQTGFVSVEQWTGNFLTVDVVGFGFCLEKREVFEKMKKPWFPWDTPAPSEDFRHCMKAKEIGYDVNVFTEVKLSHIGALNVMPDGSIKTLEL